MKRFLGWEPVTTYTYDGDRLLSSAPEVEWDEPEQTWILALQYYRDGLCPLCGMPTSICQAPENELRVKSNPPIRCHYTTQTSMRREAHTSGKNGKAKPNQPNALLYTADLKT